MFKRFLLVALMMSFNSAFAAKIANFQEAVSAIYDGKLLTFVVHFDQCGIAGDKQLAAAVMPDLAVFRPNGIIVRSDNYIRSRGLTFSQSIDAFPEMGAVNQAYTYSFDKYNQLTVVNSFLDPVTFKEKAHAIRLSCQLGKGFDVFA